jgi:hypothetical protein
MTTMSIVDHPAVGPALVESGRGRNAQPHADRPWLHFLRHLAEMVIAMLAGMLGLGTVINALPGRSALFHPPVLSALVMATNMTIGMSLWMRFRRHSRRSIAEMSAAMYIPFIILFVPFWAALLSGHLVMIGGHILMLPAMVAAMLLRRDEYTGSH